MFLAPQHLATTQNIQCTSHKPVEGFVAGIAVMGPVVHDIAAQQHQSLCERKDQKQREVPRGRKEHQQDIGQDRTAEQHAGFEKQTPVTGDACTTLQKILIDAFLDGLMKCFVLGKRDGGCEGDIGPPVS